MLIVLLSAAALVVGLVVCKLAGDFYSDVGLYLGGIIAVIGGFILIGCAIVIPGQQAYGPTEVAHYKATGFLVAQSENNDQLTGEERAQVLARATECNEKIFSVQAYAANPWTNWFVYQPIANLPLFDLGKIQKAFPKLKVLNENK